jgi:hypothetical protein
MNISSAIDIKSTPDIVFGWLKSPEKAMVWMSSVSKTEMIHETPDMVGSSFREIVEDDSGAIEMQGVISGTFPRQLPMVGILSTFGTAPGSIEGLIYTKASFTGLWGGGIEVLLQSLLLSVLTCYWVNHPEKKWLNWVLGILFFLALILPALGLLARLASS